MCATNIIRMLMIKFGILFSVFLSNYQINSLSIPIISDIQDVLSLANDINDIASGTSPVQTLFVPQPNPLNIAIEKITNIAENIESLKATIEGRFDESVRQLISRLPLEDKLNRRMERFHEQIVTVDRLFEDLIFYSNDSDYFQPAVMEDFVKAATSMQYGSLPHALSLLSGVIMTRMPLYFHKGLFNLLLQKQNEATTVQDRCDNSESFQRRIFEIYSMAVLTELRAHAVSSFAYRFIAEHRNVSVEANVKRSEARLIFKVEEYMLGMRDTLTDFSGEIYRCDPPEHILNETHYEIVGPFTSMLVSTRNLPYRHRICEYDTCDGISTTELIGCHDNIGYCGKHSCKGRVHSCFKLDGLQVHVCENPAGSPKFFYNAEDTQGYFQNYHGCPYNWYRSKTLFDPIYTRTSCSNCLCICDQSGPGVPGLRTISLRPQMTSIENNTIVTNIRFLLQDDMIHIQIEHAPLKPFGEIHDNRKEWMSVGNYQHEEDEEGNTFYEINNDDKTELKEDQDYVIIQPSRRLVNLDDVMAPRGYLVTGVRFSLKGSSNDRKVLQLEVNVTPWDKHTGKLVPTEEKPSYWINANTQPVKPIIYDHPRKPIGSHQKRVYTYDDEVQNDIFLEPNKQIEFDRSDTREDIGQTTTPLIDARPALVRSRAVNGLGLIWRGSEEYAGFIAFKVYGISDGEFIRPHLTSAQYNYYRDMHATSSSEKAIIDDSKVTENRKK